MKLSPHESDEQRLIYRGRSYWFIGLPLAILGLSLLTGNGGEIIRRWPHSDGLFEGLTLGGCLTAIGSALIRSKSTAYGRVTRRASSGPACILRVVIPGLGVMRAIQELPPPSDRESARRATGMASDCLTTPPPTGATYVGGPLGGPS